MSKKLIAVAAAAALALTGLVAAPATADAGAFTVTPVGQTTAEVNGFAATTAIQINTPSQDAMRWDNSVRATPATGATTGTLLRLEVQTTAVTAGVTATSTGGVQIITSAQYDARGTTALTHKSGSQSASVTSNSQAEAFFYVYSTSTTAGTVTIAQGANSRVLHIQGTSPVANAYKISFTTPASTSIGGKIKFTGTVVDMFGNLLTLAVGDFVTTTLGGSLDGTAVTASPFAVAGTTKVTTFELPASTTASGMAVSVALTAPAAEFKTAFGGRVSSQFFSVSAQDLSVQVTALTAQVAALQASMADMRTKARSVTLKRWNNLVKRHRALGGSAKLKTR